MDGLSLTHGPLCATMSALVLLFVLVGSCFCASVCFGIQYGAKQLPLEQGVCPSQEVREVIRAEVTAEVEAILRDSVCNGSPGWRRVVFVNMTDPSHNCPPRSQCHQPLHQDMWECPHLNQHVFLHHLPSERAGRSVGGSERTSMEPRMLSTST